MSRLHIAGLVFFFFFFSFTTSADQYDPTAEIKKNQPRPVAALIDRIVGCNHWLGETPYDMDREKQISEAISSLRCNELKKDETAVLNKYRTNPKVKKAIDMAKDMVL